MFCTLLDLDRINIDADARYFSKIHSNTFFNNYISYTNIITFTITVHNYSNKTHFIVIYLKLEIIFSSHRANVQNTLEVFPRLLTA
jgi:hypothetical protein